MTATIIPEAPNPDTLRAPKVRTKESASKSIFDRAIIGSASIDAIRKLNPRTMYRNPVMFIVEVGSLITTADLHP